MAYLHMHCLRQFKNLQSCVTMHVLCERRHQEAMSEDGVSSMIEGFDRQHLGGAQPRRTQTKPASKQPVKQLAPDASSSGIIDQDNLQDAEPHVQVSMPAQPTRVMTPLLVRQICLNVH